MTDTIIEYFRRFDNSVTESIYTTITMDDYYKNKAAMEYLDYDRETLFRKNKLYCGIRNIDNSCYLSATLQILFNIQWLRERIFRVSDSDASDFIKELQKLFALMHKGSLVYADPSELFAVLKKLYPDVFVVGAQNDFHEVFTIVLEQLEKSLTTEDDKKFFRKLFYGRMKVQLTDQKGKVTSTGGNESGNSFNLINLVSAHKNFDNALKAFKSEIIDGYMSESGEKMKASKQINFLQTPAILSFFINRVSFQDKKLVKDSSEFNFEEKIMFAKANATKVVKNNDAELEKHINQLHKWILQVKDKKQLIAKTLAYFEQQEFTNINIPSIQNPLGEQCKNSTKKFLKAQLEQIDKQTSKTQNEIAQLQKKRIKEAEDNYSQLYNLWAVMIHCGTTAESGHYKICIKIDPINNVWVELNDRRTDEIPQEKIMEYKKKGQICCLFYKRSTLVSQPEKAQIPISLKKYVQEEEQKIFKKIDNARILQALYQECESVNIIWQFQNTAIRQQEKLSTYFFRPLLHLILSNTPPQTCKGYLLYETIQEPRFIEILKGKFIEPNREIKIPSFDFGIPTQYWSIAEALKEFLCLQSNNPIEAYTFILFYMDITIKNPITREYFFMLREVLLLKAIFYEAMLVEVNLLPSYEELSKIVDKICKVMGEDNRFVLHLVPLRSAIQNKYINKIVDKKEDDEQKIGVLKKHPSFAVTNVSVALFSKRFGFWIDQRKKAYYDESILNEYRKFYPLYATLL